jgi:hypothetical protein
MKIYRDAQGKCINIGEWDYRIDDNGNSTNPLLDGAVESDEQVIVGWDGGAYVYDDPRAVKS